MHFWKRAKSQGESQNYVITKDIPGADALDHLIADIEHLEWQREQARRQNKELYWWDELKTPFYGESVTRLSTKDGPEVGCFFLDAEDQRYVGFCLVLRVPDELKCGTEWVIGLTKEVRGILIAHIKDWEEDIGHEIRSSYGDDADFHFLDTLNTYALPACPSYSRVPLVKLRICYRGGQAGAIVLTPRLAQSKPLVRVFCYGWRREVYDPIPTIPGRLQTLWPW